MTHFLLKPLSGLGSLTGSGKRRHSYEYNVRANSPDEAEDKTHVAAAGKGFSLERVRVFAVEVDDPDLVGEGTHNYRVVGYAFKP
jgi:hypothetical protein